MDLKQQNHWRTRTDYVHRFAYNGFLTCATCEEPVQTALARRDYYACKGRRTAHKCPSKYMVREKLEKGLDELFAEHLTRRCFLEQCVEVLQQRSVKNASEVAILGLTQEIKALGRKRERIVDSFIDGALTREARDQRLTTVDRGIRSAQDGLASQNGVTGPMR
jgi:tRNA isopentenyl-2-thiomethyl-A-37 hydroxylase MiaE